jgi:hypothetical protein
MKIRRWQKEFRKISNLTSKEERVIARLHGKTLKAL